MDLIPFALPDDVMETRLKHLASKYEKEISKIMEALHECCSHFRLKNPREVSNVCVGLEVEGIKFFNDNYTNCDRMRYRAKTQAEMMKGMKGLLSTLRPFCRHKGKGWSLVAKPPTKEDVRKGWVGLWTLTFKPIRFRVRHEMRKRGMPIPKITKPAPRAAKNTQPATTQCKSSTRNNIDDMFRAPEAVCKRPRGSE